MYIDLHIHTTASDGSFTPSEVVRYAKEKGLGAIAITDHDSIEGNEEAMEEGTQQGVEVIPGVEISVDYAPGSMHLLGYFVTTGSKTLKGKLTLLQNTRAERNPKILERLNQLGLMLTYDEVVQASGGGQIGRPHIAQALLKRGYIKTIPEAFDKYLGKGAPAYIEKFRLTAEEAISMIAETEGIPVLAHPFTLHCKNSHELESLVKNLVSHGLKGIEVYYSEHNRAQTSSYLRLVQHYNLVATGGSDFHGENMEGVDLGIGRGNLKVPYRVYEELRTLWEERRHQ